MKTIKNEEHLEDAATLLARYGYDPREIRDALKQYVGLAGYPAIPLILDCPVCHARHVDEGVWATRPHKVHSCQSCGWLFQPSLAPTVGVQFLPGCKNGGG